MKNKPLAFQIWLVFAAVALGITLLLSVLLPFTLRNFFTKEIYQTIESAQESHLSRGLENIPPLDRFRQNQDIRVVNHILITESQFDLRVESQNRIPISFLRQIKRQADQQETGLQRYTSTLGDEKIFYVIRKGEYLGTNIYLISYMWDTYREEMVNGLFRHLLMIMGVALVLTWIPAIGLARLFSRPLVQMEKHVRNIAERQWDQPITVNRNDEIGRLARSIEWMRRQLVKQNETQQNMLHHISHELKTPVMVIRSYAQAIKDGIYPKGDLSATLQVVEDEALRLEKRIKDLIYLTRLDYLSTMEPRAELIHLDEVLKNVLSRFQYTRTDIQWDIDIHPVRVTGDAEQWEIAFENLIDNQLRYAASTIRITLDTISNSGEKKAVIRMWNDGPPIDEDLLDRLFDKFQKGEKGQFGLGLAIVNKIVSLHTGNIAVINREKGVEFIIEVPVHIN